MIVASLQPTLLTNIGDSGEIRTLKHLFYKRGCQGIFFSLRLALSAMGDPAYSAAWREGFLREPDNWIRCRSSSLPIAASCCTTRGNMIDRSNSFAQSLKWTRIFPALK